MLPGMLGTADGVVFFSHLHPWVFSFGFSMLKRAQWYANAKKKSSLWLCSFVFSRGEENGRERLTHKSLAGEREWLAWKPLKGFWKNEMQMTTESWKLCRQTIHRGTCEHTHTHTEISSLSPSRWLKLQLLMKMEAASSALLINMKTVWMCACNCVHIYVCMSVALCF